MRDVCFYDGRCGLCRRTTSTLRRLDWLSRLEFRDMTTTPDLPVSFEQAMTGMPMRTRDGQVLVGFPAVRRALVQTPLGCPVAAIMYLPGISALSRRVYGAIARNRGRDVCNTIPHVPQQASADPAQGQPIAPHSHAHSR